MMEYKKTNVLELGPTDWELVWIRTNAIGQDEFYWRRPVRERDDAEIQLEWINPAPHPALSPTHKPWPPLPYTWS